MQLERWSPSVKMNGTFVRYIGSPFARGGGGWYDEKTWHRVPDRRAHELDYKHPDIVRSLRFRVVVDADEGKEEGQEQETVIDAHDVIAGRRGRAGSDIGYELAVDDVEKLVSMGASNASMDAYTDESDSEPDAHGADSFMEVEMVA